MYSTFETEIIVRPDDIDMYNHVHNSKYLDYVLAARYDQMIKNYRMPIDEFHKLGFNWVVSEVNIKYKRPLKLGDTAIVKTRLDSFGGAQSFVSFSIEIKSTGKLSCDGQFTYTMVSLSNGRPARIPQEIIDKFTI